MNIQAKIVSNSRYTASEALRTHRKMSHTHRNEHGPQFWRSNVPDVHDGVFSPSTPLCESSLPVYMRKTCCGDCAEGLGTVTKLWNLYAIVNGYI